MNLRNKINLFYKVSFLVVLLAKIIRSYNSILKQKISIISKNNILVKYSHIGGLK